MDKMIKDFTVLALQYKDKSIIDLFNYYLTTLSKESAEGIGELFHMFIRAAETAREADPRIQKLIISS